MPRKQETEQFPSSVASRRCSRTWHKSTSNPHVTEDSHSKGPGDQQQHGEASRGRSSPRASLQHGIGPKAHSIFHAIKRCTYTAPATHAAGTTKDVLTISPCVQGRLTWARHWGKSPSQEHFSARRAANLPLGGQLVPVAQAQTGAHCECT